MTSRVNHSFAAYYQNDSTVLILGSMPSVKSRELGFYYMHPQNSFWKVLSRVYEEKYPDSISLKKDFLKRKKVALWDVIESCEIKQSSDSSIRQATFNDISNLLQKTKIRKIYTTGKKAYELYQKNIYPQTKIEAIYLPSTSPANAVLSEDDLVSIYQIIKETI